MLEGLVFSGLSPAGASGRLSTLIFHRVLLQPDPLFPEEVDEQRFDLICGWIRQWFNVLPLDEAVRRLVNRTLPARAMAITFDDGYRDNWELALPILRSHGLTATFFVATGFLDGGRMWNDTIIESVRRTRRPRLDLTGIDSAHLAVYEIGTNASRRAAIDQILPKVKYLPPSERTAVSDRLAELADIDLPQDLMMTSDQVRELGRAGMQIGAHTVSHPILSRITERAALAEMRDSKRELEEVSGTEVSLFAYPNGRPADDYGARDVLLARECGFTAAMSTAWGAANCNSDIFQLPRFTPWSSSRWRFSAHLARNLLRR